MNALRRRWLAWRHGGGPWAALFERPPPGEVVSLDLETTGLDTASDRILRIAAVPVRGGRVMLSERFERWVDPGRAFGIDSIRHHRILPGDVAAAEAERDVVEAFLRWLGPRPLLGYCIDFDIALLDRVFHAAAGFALPNRRIDVAELDFRRQWLIQPETARRRDLDAILADAGVPPLQRHDALGDAAATALAWCVLRARAGEA
ncbi:MAG TPA: 3'-5' exonuclease [Xanthomonadaceae bacterium]|nr:3'-5' exonuclease [Xanthomonadaceae bacterium]